MGPSMGPSFIFIHHPSNLIKLVGYSWHCPLPALSADWLGEALPSSYWAPKACRCGFSSPKRQGNCDFYTNTPWYTPWVFWDGTTFLNVRQVLLASAFLEGTSMKFSIWSLAILTPHGASRFVVTPAVKKHIGIHFATQSLRPHGHALQLPFAQDNWKNGFKYSAA